MLYQLSYASRSVRMSLEQFRHGMGAGHVWENKATLTPRLEYHAIC